MGLPYLTKEAYIGRVDKEFKSLIPDLFDKGKMEMETEAEVLSNRIILRKYLQELNHFGKLSAEQRSHFSKKK